MNASKSKKKEFYSIVTSESSSKLTFCLWESIFALSSLTYLSLIPSSTQAFKTDTNIEYQSKSQAYYSSFKITSKFLFPALNVLATGSFLRVSLYSNT
jgi:hypothetical protein